jgi:hypothetical protein
MNINSKYRGGEKLKENKNTKTKVRNSTENFEKFYLKTRSLLFFYSESWKLKGC